MTSNGEIRPRYRVYDTRTMFCLGTGLRGPATIQSRVDKGHHAAKDVVKSKKIDRSHIAEHVAAKDRARANPQVLHESGGNAAVLPQYTRLQTNRQTASYGNSRTCDCNVPLKM